LELLVVAAFCLLNLAIPLVITDLYPFSRAPMFADAPRRYCNYRLVAPDGQELALAEFALQRNYWGNPLGVGVGYVPPESFDRFGEVPPENELLAHVRAQLARRPDLAFVNLTREVVGPHKNGRVGVVEWSFWRVENPHAAEGRP
jgi:hypothetical protein